jgi:hypothetical protein
VLLKILDKDSKNIFIGSKGSGFPGGQIDLGMVSYLNSNFGQL